MDIFRVFCFFVFDSGFVFFVKSMILFVLKKIRTSKIGTDIYYLQIYYGFFCFDLNYDFYCIIMISIFSDLVLNAEISDFHTFLRCDIPFFNYLSNLIFFKVFRPSLFTSLIFLLFSLPFYRNAAIASKVAMKILQQMMKIMVRNVLSINNYLFI